MKQKIPTAVQKIIGAAAIFLFLAFAAPLQAKTYVVQFGGSLGDVYSPASFNVSVGDTVQWVGTFAAHPLSSTSVPAGAATFHVASGSTFSYRVTAAGSYQYKCDFHVSLGMEASFTASAATSVANDQNAFQPNLFRLEQNYPNPFNPSTVIGYQLPVTGLVTMKVYNILGKEVATLVNETKEAGSYAVHFDASGLASGTYFYKLSTGTSTSVKKLVLMK
jgi:plastocyanin